VNVFPDQEGAHGYPGTDFGNACGGSYYKSPDGKQTKLLESCPLIGSDIKYCQAQGKMILLSLGGAQPDVYIASESSAKDMAEFLWGAFGPVKNSWNGPRPFGDVSVDGFDFDIESEAARITGPVDFGYAIMVDHFRHLYAAEDKTYYISGAPQCVIPDSHLSDAISKSIFDFM
jgi:chitinase